MRGDYSTDDIEAATYRCRIAELRRKRVAWAVAMVTVVIFWCGAIWWLLRTFRRL